MIESSGFFMVDLFQNKLHCKTFQY